MPVKTANNDGNELERRLFGGGQDPLPPLQLPGVETRQEALASGMRIGPNGVQPSAPSNSPPLNPADLAKARAFARVLAQLIQNTNVTASLPAHVQPTVFSNPVDLVKSFALPAAVSDYLPVLTYTVPQGRWARISTYGVNVLDPAFTYDGSILWSIQVNGIPVPYLTDFGDQRGTVQQPRSTVIILKEGWIVSFKVKRAVVAGAPTPMVLALNGWDWRLRFNYDSTQASIAAT